MMALLICLYVAGPFGNENGKCPQIDKNTPFTTPFAHKFAWIYIDLREVRPKY